MNDPPKGTISFCLMPHYEERKDMYLNASDLDGLRHKNADPLRSECAVSPSRLVALVLASVYDICQAVDARVGPEEMPVLSVFEDGEVPTEGDVLHDDGRVLNAWSLIVTQQHHLKNEPCSLSESDSSASTKRTKCQDTAVHMEYFKSVIIGECSSFDESFPRTSDYCTTFH